MPISISNLTANVATSAAPDYTVTGDGVLDDIMEVVNAHLDAQYKLGRITGTDYSTVYLGAMQAAIEQAVAFTTGAEKVNAEVALLGQKEITEFAQTEQTTKTAPTTTSTSGRQNKLFEEQAKGFKWNADQKYLKTLLDSWSINVSTAGVPATNVSAINADGGINDINAQIANAKPTD